MILGERYSEKSSAHPDGKPQRSVTSVCVSMSSSYEPVLEGEGCLNPVAAPVVTGAGQMFTYTSACFGTQFQPSAT